jgi:hypothetical protein
MRADLSWYWFVVHAAIVAAVWLVESTGDPLGPRKRKG